MMKSTVINDEESSMAKYNEILNTRAKEYHSDLEQVMFITSPKSKKELQWIDFLK